MKLHETGMRQKDMHTTNEANMQISVQHKISSLSLITPIT